MTRPALLVMLLLATPVVLAADNCDAVREGIDKKIRAAGVASFTLEVIDAAASAPGKVVGNCARGGRLIVYRRNASAPAVITECKDGSAPVDGQCPKK